MDKEFFKRYPIFTGLVAVCVLAFAVELFLVFRASSATGKADRALKSAVSTLTTTLSATPAATSDNLQTAQKNLKDLQEQLSGIVNSLGSAGNFSTPPTDAVTLMADVQHYVDNFKAQAKTNGVVIADPGNFTFGMGQYYGPVTPPPPEKIPVVFKQMEILEYILSQLYAAKAGDPDQKLMLETVEREDMVAAANTGGNPNDSGPKDTFTVAPLVSAKQPGAVDTLAFRFKFIAYTDTLRVFLNELAQFEYPLVVRSVEVEPATEDTLNAAIAAANPAAGTAAGGSVSAAAVALPGGDASATPATTAPTGPVREAVIKNNLSEFTVVIEYINLIPPKPTGAPSA